VAKRRKLITRDQSEWETLIKSCLYKSSHKSRWGCLDKKGMLFRKLTLSSIQVPMDIVYSMEDEGVLLLDDTGYYYYKLPRTKNKKRTKRQISY